MNTEQLQQQILKGLNDPAMPVAVRLADYATQQAMARILVDRLQPAQPQPPPQRQRYTSYSAASAAKYD